MRRALALDEGYERGSIHDFFISYEAGRRPWAAPSTRPGEHFERALAISERPPGLALRELRGDGLGGGPGPPGVRAPSEQALAVDPDRAPEERLANLVAQRRARWLLSRADELFVG